MLERGAIPKERVCKFAFARVRAWREVCEKERREEKGRGVRMWWMSSVGRLRR